MTTKPISKLAITRALNLLLEREWFPDTLKIRHAYCRTHDDCDGDHSQELGVVITNDGDVHVITNSSMSLRFRTWAGGGLSLRVRKALLVLAEAIRRDNEQRPMFEQAEDRPFQKAEDVLNPHLIDKREVLLFLQHNKDLRDLFEAEYIREPFEVPTLSKMSGDPQ